MNTVWQQLEIAALMGAGKTAPVTDWPHSLQTLMENVSGRDDSRELLMQLAVLAPWQRAGQQLPMVDALPAAEPELTLKPLNTEARRCLQTALADRQELLPALLQALADGAYHAPHASLPALLKLAEQRRELRLPLGKVAGARGQWLAAQNPAWRWLTGATLPVDSDAATVNAFWQDAGQPARELFFIRWRLADADGARGWLQTLWPTESAASRAALLALCRHGLHAADTGWLDSLLDDRSKPVREQAVALLMRLPDSPWRQRMQAAAATCIQVKRGLIRKNLEIIPPETLTPALTRDGLEPLTAPSQGLGEKAVWLRTIIAGAGCEWLLAHSGMDAQTLVAALGKTDWKDVLLQGLALAAPATGHAGMLNVLLAQSLSPSQALSLLQALPDQLREETLMQQAQAAKNLETGLMLLGQRLSGLTPWRWSEAFTTAVLRGWQGLAATVNPGPDYLRLRLSSLHQPLSLYGCTCLLPALPPGLPEVAETWRFRLHAEAALAAGAPDTPPNSAAPSPMPEPLPNHHRNQESDHE